MRVLIACEFSGVVRDAFLSVGCDAMSCDLLPTESDGPHYQGNIQDIIGDGWEIMIAHPPCTYLSLSGVRHLYGEMNEGDKALKGPQRWKAAYEAAEFFRMLWSAPIPHVCVENPVMHGYGKSWIDRRHKPQTVQPWWFGHPEKKATQLWLRNLPPLQKTNDVFEEMQQLPEREKSRTHRMSPADDRGHKRSVTFAGLAKAMAEQWGIE